MGAWLPLVAYLASVFAFHSFAVTKPPPPIAPPTFSRFCGELGCGLVLYDMLFAVVHKSLHSKRSPSWWRKVHRTHHEARPSERRGHSLAPLETVQHSFTDGFLQAPFLTPSFFSSQTTPLFLASFLEISGGAVSAFSLSLFPRLL